MNYPPKPNYSKGQIDRAGISASASKPGSAEYIKSVKIINEWRAAHSYPIHTFYVTLRRKASAITKHALVARRLKRLPTILDKLANRQQSMSLSRMQDIGGVRAIMPSISQVYELRDMYIQKGRFTHIPKKPHDYIAEPKSSGYRGIHLVYTFNNVQGRSPEARNYDGLNIEVQLRTQLQHEWATAVEIVSTVIQNDLKSSLGDARWLDFFKCMSSVIAILEDSPVLEVHRNWSTQKLFKYTTGLINDLNVFDAIAGWVASVKHISEGSGGYYHILLLDSKEKSVRVIRFEETELEQANEKLAELEAEASTSGSPEPVLVAAGDIHKIKRAYPNYFLDMKDFLVMARLVVATTNE